jgi:hypothetical protein
MWSISTFNQTITENLGFTGRRKSTGEDVIQSFSDGIHEESQLDVADVACNDEDVAADEECLARSAWREVLGEKCLARSAWREVLGEKCLARSAWREVQGGVIVLRSLRREVQGGVIVLRSLRREVAKAESIRREILFAVRVLQVIWRQYM